MKNLSKLIGLVFVCLLVLSLVSTGSPRVANSADSSFPEAEIGVIEELEKNIDIISEDKDQSGDNFGLGNNSPLVRTSVEFLEAKLKLYQWNYR